MTDEQRFEYPTGKSRRRRAAESLGDVTGRLIGEGLVKLSDAIVFGDMRRQDAMDEIDREGLFGATGKLSARIAGRVISASLDGAVVLRRKVLSSLSAVEPSSPKQKA